MNPRIEKKLSKKLALLCPSLFGEAWVSDEPSELAYEKNSSISHCYHLGGQYCSHMGDSANHYSVWDWWIDNWMWHGDFSVYPEGHELEYYPDTTGFKPSTIKLIDLAIECEIKARRHSRKLESFQ